MLAINNDEVVSCVYFVRCKGAMAKNILLIRKICKHVRIFTLFIRFLKQFVTKFYMAKHDDAPLC